MTDLISLIDKYKSIIEILNICAITYIFIVEFIVMFFIVFNLKKTTKIIEDITLRINKSFNLMLNRHTPENKSEDPSFMIYNN